MVLFNTRLTGAHRSWQGVPRRQWPLPCQKGSTQSMGIDKLTHRASPWHPAAALQYSGREQPFPTHCALLRNIAAMPDLENMLTEEPLAPDFVDIADDNDPHIIIPVYSIRKEIAKGGISTVLLAKRLEDDLDVVLKVLFTKGLEDSSGLKRFIQEYDLISAMNHPHIIRIYERAFASEFAYIALEYLPQGDLSKRISEGISTETAMSYLRQIALGLGAIHKLNIIHRDLKPGNILFHNDGTLTITDFGAAKIISDKMKDITMNNMVVGTPYYMSPEQCTGKKIDRRSDIYSPGVDADG